jgi:hypothetical protein
VTVSAYVQAGAVTVAPAGAASTSAWSDPQATDGVGVGVGVGLAATDAGVGVGVSVAVDDGAGVGVGAGVGLAAVDCAGVGVGVAVDDGAAAVDAVGVDSTDAVVGLALGLGVRNSAECALGPFELPFFPPAASVVKIGITSAGTSRRIGSVASQSRTGLRRGGRLDRTDVPLSGHQRWPSQNMRWALLSATRLAPRSSVALRPRLATGVLFRGGRPSHRGQPGVRDSLTRAYVLPPAAHTRPYVLGGRPGHQDRPDQTARHATAAPGARGSGAHALVPSDTVLLDVGVVQEGPQVYSLLLTFGGHGWSSVISSRS